MLVLLRIVGLQSSTLLRPNCTYSW